MKIKVIVIAILGLSFQLRLLAQQLPMDTNIFYMTTNGTKPTNDCGICDGTINIYVIHSWFVTTPPYTFTITRPGTTWSMVTSDTVITGICAGVYSIDGVDSEGRTGWAYATIHGNGSPSMSLIVTGSNPTCSGCCDGVLNASASGGTPPYTFAFSTGDTIVSGGSVVLNNLCEGFHTLMVGGITDPCYNQATGLVLQDPPSPDSSTLITGNIYHDFNGNCYLDSVDRSVTNPILYLEPTGQYFTPGNTGSYKILVEDTGSYTLMLLNPNDKIYQLKCPDSTGVVSFSVANLGDTIVSPDFSIIGNGSFVEVNVNSTFLRPCQNAIYYINYKNSGTDTAYATELLLELANSVSVDTVAAFAAGWVQKSGNCYSFTTGNLPPDFQSNLSIKAKVSCDANMGETVCAKAQILPNNTFPVDSVWDKSSIVVEGVCENDSTICFTIYNTGDSINGVMTAPSQWRLYADNVLVQMGTFQLNGHDSLPFCFHGNGSTFRLEADQRPGHPGNSKPRAFVELCGNPNSSMGFITTIPQDDQDANVDINCTVLINSYDPNMKYVQPKGVTANSYIQQNTLIDYEIHFQNTGTDTAFIVVVRDTISPFLDPGSIKLGSSSHNYEFKLFGSGIAEWTFNNINLVDSNTNEPASHGILSFTINQSPNNTSGTVITNSAGIWFDNNAPIITNTTINTIHDTVITSDSLVIYLPLEVIIAGCDSIQVGGAYYSINLTTTDTLLSNSPNVLDSIIETHYNVYATSFAYIQEESCGGYYSSSGNLLDSSGVYLDIITNVFGCDSIIEIDLLVTVIDTTVQILQSLVASNQTADLQWLNCDSGFSSIPGAVSQVFNPEFSGNYALVLSENNCIDTTLCHHFITTEVQTNLVSSRVDILPNPFHRNVTFDLTGLDFPGIYNLLIFDVTGKMISEMILEENVKHTINLGYELRSGVYLFKLLFEDELLTVGRIIKE